jgi:hypothetical protein
MRSYRNYDFVALALWEVEFDPKMRPAVDVHHDCFLPLPEGALLVPSHMLTNIVHVLDQVQLGSREGHGVLGQDHQHPMGQGPPERRPRRSGSGRVRTIWPPTQWA